MKQPYSPIATSHVDNEIFQPRVARSPALKRQRLKKEAFSMSARIAPLFQARTLVARFSIPASLLAALFFFSTPLRAQTTAHSPGWVVITVDDYRTLRHKAFPAERDPEPPPVDATLTRVDYDLR